MVSVSLPIWRGKLRAGVAEAQAMRAMSEADLRAMARMIEGDAAVAVNKAPGRPRSAGGAHQRRAAARAPGDRTGRRGLRLPGQLPLVSVIEAVQALWLVPVVRPACG